MFVKAVRQSSPCFAYVDLLSSVQVMQLMTFTEMHIKCSVTLADRLGPEILTVLDVKGQVLHAFSRFQFDSSFLDILQRI